MTRAEHLQWAKDRAMKYADNGDAANAMASIGSDLDKHSETANHAGIELGMMLLMTGHMRDPAAIRKFIDGFN